MTLSYDTRIVPAHDKNMHAPVYLINEAPGPDEAISGIPLFGQQGSNLFHALRNAGILWAVHHDKFVWPKNDNLQQSERQQQKTEFLVTRSKYITCTNSYSCWPKPNNGTSEFCRPLDKDILSSQNIERIKGELHQNHVAILICGTCAYLACTGNKLSSLLERESSELSPVEIKTINTRLKSNFKKGWYMGHTRRWSLQRERSSGALRDLAEFMNWPYEL